LDYLGLLEMIKCNLSRMMGEKKLKISDVAKDTGINRGTVTRLYHETAVRVDFDVLEKLCIYLECEISEMFNLPSLEQESNQYASK
jgi:putative transcriptional regulator